MWPCGWAPCTKTNDVSTYCHSTGKWANKKNYLSWLINDMFSAIVSSSPCNTFFFWCCKLLLAPAFHFWTTLMNSAPLPWFQLLQFCKPFELAAFGSFQLNGFSELFRVKFVIMRDVSDKLVSLRRHIFRKCLTVLKPQRKNILRQESLHYLQSYSVGHSRDSCVILRQEKEKLGDGKGISWQNVLTKEKAQWLNAKLLWKLGDISAECYITAALTWLFISQK